MTIADILKVTQEDLKKNLYEELCKSEYKGKILNTENYLFVEGDLPILLVAHLDTVHKELPKNIFFDKEKNVLWSPEGIGGDDRAGIFGILQIIKECKPYLLFITDEEVGGLGAIAFTKEYKYALNKKIKFILELDRRGDNQVVFYDCGNKEFKDYIKKFGLVEQYGTFSDICILSAEYDIASANISAGYYNEHTKQEYININHLKNTIEVIKKIILDIDNSKYYDYQEEKYYYKYYEKKEKKKAEKQKKKSEQQQEIEQEYEYYFQMEEDYYELTDIAFEEKYGIKKPNSVKEIWDF